MEQVRWHADLYDTLVSHRASAVAYGQMGEYDEAIEHFDMCAKLDVGEDGKDCSQKLKYTKARQREGNVAKIVELSRLIFCMCLLLYRFNPVTVAIWQLTGQ